MTTKIPILAQAALGVVAMALISAFGFARLIDPTIAVTGVAGVFLALNPGIASGQSVDAKSFAAELIPLIAHLFPKVSALTVSKNTTVEKTVTPNPDIPVTHETTPVPASPVAPPPLPTETPKS